ncbi:hypothetical protein ACQQ4G_003121 [Listeria monocytogenes]
MNNPRNKLAAAILTMGAVMGASGFDMPYSYGSSKSYREPKEKSDAGKFVLKYRGAGAGYYQIGYIGITRSKQDATIFTSYQTAKAVADRFGCRVVKLTY